MSKPIFGFICDGTDAYFQMSVDAIKSLATLTPGATVGIVVPPNVNYKKVVAKLNNALGSEEAKHVVFRQGKIHFDNWNPTQHKLDLVEFAKEFDPVIWIDSDVLILKSLQPFITQFVQSGKKMALLKDHVNRDPHFVARWEDGPNNCFIPQACYMIFRSAIVPKFFAVWEEIWKDWITPYPFAKHKDPAPTFPNSFFCIEQYALGQAVPRFVQDIQAEVFIIDRTQLYVGKNIAAELAGLGPNKGAHASSGVHPFVPPPEFHTGSASAGGAGVVGSPSSQTGGSESGTTTANDNGSTGNTSGNGNGETDSNAQNSISISSYISSYPSSYTSTSYSYPSFYISSYTSPSSYSTSGVTSYTGATSYVYTGATSYTTAAISSYTGASTSVSSYTGATSYTTGGVGASSYSTTGASITSYLYGGATSYTGATSYNVGSISSYTTSLGLTGSSSYNYATSSSGGLAEHLLASAVSLDRIGELNLPAEINAHLTGNAVDGSGVGDDQKPLYVFATPNRDLYFVSKSATFANPAEAGVPPDFFMVDLVQDSSIAHYYNANYGLPSDFILNFAPSLVDIIDKEKKKTIPFD